ncbi:MAG: TM2 domain-containing protein [Cellvibrionaceae bacterium]
MDLETVKQHEEALRLQVRQLDDSQRKQFYHQFNQQMKDPDTYAVLNYLFLAGLHHFYLGNMSRGWLNLLVFGAGVLLMVVGLAWMGIALIVLISVIELKALFQSESVVTDHNNRLMESLLTQFRSG